MWSWSGGMFNFDLPSPNNVGIGAFFDAATAYETLGCTSNEYVARQAKTKCDK